ncbi:MAG: right-handed parallel beta-helix repeat-containing protein [Thermomicrobiales bacterium]
MDALRFDAVTRAFTTLRTRRTAASALAVAVAAPLLGVVVGDAKKKKKRKATLCLNGQTVSAAKKKKKKLIKQGATPGACCVPQCAAGACGSDGCGGTCACAAGTVCDGGTCHACTVTCTGSPAACGSALQTALNAGGTIYACPGVYTGGFTIPQNNTALVGAGSGDDFTANTVLDGNNVVIVVAFGGTGIRLAGLRIKRGMGNYGGGIQAGYGSDLTVERCAIVNNTANAGGAGLYFQGRLQLRDSLVTGNTASYGGGVYMDASQLASTITNTTISGNIAGSGAGLSQYNAALLTISGGEISSNHATGGGGGGLTSFSSVLQFTGGTRLTNNTATSPGGAIYTTGSTIQLGDAVFSGNTPNDCTGC